MALQSTAAIATITLQQTTSSITFSGIPNTYRDLVLVGNYTSVSNGVLEAQFNEVPGSLVRTRMFAGSVLGVYADTFSDANTGEYKPSDLRNLIEIQILDYSATNKHKLSLIRSNGLDRTMSYAQRWASTQAVTSYKITATGNFTAGSTFSLYGRIA